MKKVYNSPALDIVNVQLQAMIAISINNNNAEKQDPEDDNYGGGDGLAKDFNNFVL